MTLFEKRKRASIQRQPAFYDNATLGSNGKRSQTAPKEE
jgi:hypothetical protein